MVCLRVLPLRVMTGLGKWQVEDAEGLIGVARWSGQPSRRPWVEAASRWWFLEPPVGRWSWLEAVVAWELMLEDQQASQK